MSISARHIVTAANSRIGNYAPSSIFPYSIWDAEELFIKEKGDNAKIGGCLV
jgi:hypothetical protein